MNEHEGDWLTNLRGLVVEKKGVEHVMSTVLHPQKLQELSTEQAHL